MNQRGISIMGFILFVMFLLGVGVYFSGGIYSSLVGLGIGDPIFFQILGMGMLVLALVSLTR